ncbi:VrrA/YqfQ family protein [Jeotgalibacillus salarius]|uniref:YqfQ-like protein n=1 Tax=Jeotgalibacillus salarius TaxID=546023 RepID=A0A4Y8LEG5_9BACL|nr:VrrA/YqfQ family protein [Jeotgalibacillus salarius]TFE01131.1 hypothetical protein E2626_10755 [Jeotgalibacillus salarius]
MYGYRPYYFPYQVVNTAPRSTAISLASLQKWAGTAQQFIKTANQYMPYVQQYGPMVKNFPAMWRLYKAFNELEDANTKKEDTKDSSNIPPKKEPVRITESIPKLYI